MSDCVCGAHEGLRHRALDRALHQTGGQTALGWRPWPAGGNGENAAISTGSRILMLLDEALVWFDLGGALGVGVSMASDLGVLGEDCEAMVVISEKGTKLGNRSSE